MPDSSTPVRVTTPAWRRMLKLATVVTALTLVFGWLLPKFIDYDQVWAAMTELDGAEIALLVGVALARVPTEALVYRAFLPGLSVWSGSAAYLSSNFAGQLLPPPGSSVVQYGYFRRDGYSADAAGLAAAGSFLFPTLGRFLLPVVAVVVLALGGDIDGSIVLIGALAVVITIAASAAGYAFLRGEQSARRLGSLVQRSLSRALVMMKREPIDDGPDRAAALRTQTLIVLQAGWRLGTVAVVANLALTFLILLASLRFVGVSSAECSAADAFAAFAIAFWAGAVIPVTGSGLGVVDAVLIALLAEFSGADDDALVAAALLWRIFYSVLILPLGAITLSRFKR